MGGTNGKGGERWEKARREKEERKVKRKRRGGERRKGAAEGTKIQYNIGRENFWEGQLQNQEYSLSTSSELEQIRPACLHKWRGCVN